MKTFVTNLTLFAGILALAATAQAGVSVSVDSVTTQASTSWSGSPAGTLAQSISTPSSQNSFDGGVSSGVIFKAGSSFTLGAAEIDILSYTGGTGNFSLRLYDFGSSYVLPAGNPVYTFTGSEVNLFSAGLNVTLANANQFNVLTFSGADNVSITSGDSYWFGLVATDGSSLTWHRGPITPNQDIAVNSTVAVGAIGDVLNNGGTAANRTPVAAFFAVPEPTSMAFLGLGALAFVVRRRK